MSTAESKQRIAIGVGAVSSARTVGGILNVLILVVLTRLLDKPDFAVVILAYIVQDTITAIGPLGLPSAMSFHLPKLGHSIARALGLQTAQLLVGLSLPFAAGLLIFASDIAVAFGMPDAALPLTYVGLAVIADFPGRAWPDFLVAKEAWRPAFFVTVAFYLTRFASLVVPAALGASPDVIVMWLAIVAGVRGLGFFAWLIFVEPGELGPGIRKRWTIGSLFSYGVPLSMTQIVGKLNLQLDKYMIAALMTAEAFAVYSAGAVELPLVPGIAYAATAALIPVLVRAGQRRDTADFLSYWHGSMVKVAALMMPTAVALFVLGEAAVAVLFSADYADAAAPFRVYLMLLPLRLCAYGAVLRALGSTKPILIASVIGLAVNAGLNYPFYLWVGLTGPALASVVSQLVQIVLLLAVIRRTLDLSWGAVFPFGPVGRALAVAALAAPPLWFVLPYLDGYALQLGAGLALYFAVYVPLARFTGVISAADLRYALRFVSLQLARKEDKEKPES